MMTLDKNDKIKDLFSSKLKGFEAEAPAFSWGALDGDVPTGDPAAEQVASTAGEAAKAASTMGSRTVLLTSLATVAACVATVILLLPKDVIAIDDAADPLVEQVADQPIQDVVHANQAHTPTIAQQPKTFYADNNFVKRSPREKSEPKTEFASNLPADWNSRSKNEKDTPSEERKYNGPDMRSGADTYEYAEDSEKSTVTTTSSKPLKRVSNTKKKGRDSGFGLSLTTGMDVFASDMSQKAGSQMLFSQGQRSSGFLDALNELNEDVRLEHSQPISFGVLVSKSISRDWALETGLIYTRLSSKATSVGVFGVRETQKFDYIGVPINLNYTFLRLGKAQFYATAGLMLQKDVNGSYTSEVSRKGWTPSEIESGVSPTPYINDMSFAELNPSASFYMNEPNYVKEKINQRHIQLSVQGLVGASFPIYRRLYIYGTAGVSHYIDAKNEYKTIYSDKKTQLDLNFGVKLNF